MEYLNPKQLSIILDWSIEKCYFYFLKHEERPKDKNGDDIHDKMWFVEIPKLEELTGLPIQSLLTDVQKNFTKNKHCVDYVMKHLNCKIRPVKKYWEDDQWKFKYPKSISIPSEVRFMLTNEQRKELAEVAPSYLPVDKMNIINEHKIIIR